MSQPELSSESAVNMSVELCKRCRPFVKWVGGKSQLIDVLVEKVPGFNRYFEPFLGGGALFFKLLPERAYLSDINPELINCFKVVKQDVDSLLKELKKHSYEKDYYYSLRNVDRNESYLNWSDVQRAARFIFLNKTCFNGLYRVNSRGEFNVPFGRHKNPTIADEPNLRACSKLLENVTIKQGSFDTVLYQAQTGDFVYFDPPYVPLNETSNFTGYTREGFDVELQEHLRDVCMELNARGVSLMVSNSYTEFVLELYQSFNISTVSARRAINSNASKRGEIKEVIVTNF